MRLSQTVRTAVGTLRRKPADLLPFYVLGAAVPVIVRVGAFLGLALAYAYLEVTGRIDRLATELEGVDLQPPEPAPGREEEVLEWAEELAPALELAFPLPVIVLLAVTVLGCLVAFVALYAGAAAGQLATCRARLEGGRGLPAGVGGVSRHWRSFLGVFVLELLLWIGTGVGISLLATVVAGATADPVVGALVSLLGGLVWVFVVLAGRAVFAFAPVAVVVDDVGAFGSISNALGFLRRRLAGAVFYYLLAIVSLVAIAVLGAVLAVFEVVMAVTLVSVLVLAPFLDLVKTALYADYRGTVEPAEPAEASLASGIAAGLRAGWAELVAFVRRTPGLHALSILVGVVGFAMGWVLAEPYVGVYEASISARIEGLFPPTTALEFFANNWFVALTTAFSGVALAIPALVSIWFNGLNIGVLGRLEVEPLELLAFILPHGVVEIPAILVSGALGIHLGAVGLRAVRGRLPRSRIAAELERAFRVLVGLGILLAVAGVIEGFVSPYYFRLFL